MLSVIKLFLFCVSTVGFWELIRRNTRIDVYFLPGLTIALQTTILFAGGLLNLLPESMWLLYIAGFVGVIFSVSQDRGISFLKVYMDAGFAFLAIVMCVMLMFVRGKIFADYDNFSHWAMVVKRMLEVNRYPNFEDTTIMFQEYPLGSATYIYYFSRLISTSESIQMLAQIYMMAASIVPVFVASRKNKTAALLVALSATNLFFVYNVTVTNLLVDTLLPLVAMSGLLYSSIYCKKGNRPIEIFFAAFYMIQLIQIKNSGVFYIIMICVWILINARRDGSIRARIACMAMPFGSLVLWQKHCQYVFAAAMTSKHAMTIENYTSVFNEKTPEDIKEICLQMLRFSITWKDVWITFAIALLIGALIFIYEKSGIIEYTKMMIFSIAMYITYQLGMLAMYLFSMPGKEATDLAGNTRYTKTVLIAVLYLTLLAAVRLISRADIKKLSQGVIAIVLFASYFGHMYLCMGSIKTFIQYTDYVEEREWIELARADYEVPNNESYCILIPEDDAGYAYYLGKYIFQSNAVSTLVVNDLAEMDGISSKYIFVYDHDNEAVEQWIRNRFPEQYGNRVIIRESGN